MEQPTHPCRKCGSPIEPGSRCKPCKKRLRKAQYWANRDRAIAASAAWQQANRERQLESSRRYQERHRDEILERQRVFRDQNRDRLAEARRQPEVVAWRREYNKARYEANPEEYSRKAAAWAAANPERVRTSKARSRARAMADPERRSRIREQRRRAESKRRAAIAGAVAGRIDAAALAQRVMFYGGLCWICREAPWEHIDHVKPIAKGGPHILSNLRPACRSCNSAKSDRWPFSPSDIL